MFGIGLPEFILILAVALIVVGPEKLPELAKTVAKHLLELKKAANTFKESLEGEVANTPPGKSEAPFFPPDPYPGQPTGEPVGAMDRLNTALAGEPSSPPPDKQSPPGESPPTS